MLLYLDCADGISGDRLVAALLDLSGARPGARGPLDKVVRPALEAAGIDPRLATVEAVRRDGQAALVFSVADAPGFASFDELIVSMYASRVGQPLADAVAAVADRLRAAERAVRGERDERRHELSGVRTAVELIATAALLHDLAPERVVASPPPLAAGDRVPAGVPDDDAAVVLQLLHGIPVAVAAGRAEIAPAAETEGAEDAGATEAPGAVGESGSVGAGDAVPSSGVTTPSGAALLAQFADEYGDAPDGEVARQGLGAARSGQSDVLRAALIEPYAVAAVSANAAEAAAAETDAAAHTGTLGDTSVAATAAAGFASDPATSPADHVVLETNIDDMSPELLAHAAETLRDAGALDVWLTPALMKKGRLGSVLHVLARAEDRARLAGAVFSETTSFGLRVLPVARMYAEERRETVCIAGHDIGVRLALVDGHLATVSPEFEDCRRAAAELGRPAHVVYEAAQARARSRFSGA